MALTRREQAEYDRLAAKKRAKAKRTRAAREDDASADGVYVLSGRHATSFLERLFGDDDQGPDDDEDQADEDQEEEDDEDQEEEDDEEDPTPSRQTNRFFSGRGGRG